MSILQIALTPDGLRDMTRPDLGACGVAQGLAGALADLPPGAPVVVLIHGKGYRPGHARDCPHRLLYADRETDGRSRFVSWPRRLGLAGPGGGRHPGLAIGFGWDGRASVWAASRAADRAGAELAGLISLVRRARPQALIDLMGHSLGARVALSALPRLPAGAVGRMILMAGADFVSRAERALTSPAGRGAEVFNILSRENDIFDWLFESALAPLGGAQALGAGLGHLPNAVDVQIDGRAARRALARLGHRLAEPRAAMCHWSVYLRPGVFPFYRVLLHRREALTLERLRNALAAPAEARWARLPRVLPLPFGAPSPNLPA